VILAVTGSAVGLGNFLRFPGLAAQYGGGAFMIPYVTAFLLLGLPIAWAEWALGRRGGALGFNSCPGIFRALWRNRAAPYFGVLGVLVPVMIYMYYVFIESWCLLYAYQYLIGGMNLGLEPQAYDAAFTQAVGASADGAVFSIDNPILWSLIVCFVLNFVLIYRGLSAGIEWFCRWAMPALIVCALIVLARVLTLGTPDPAKPEQSVLNGLGHMWNLGTPEAPLATVLANPEVWMAAAGQIFFSLSVGFGVVITYASYLKPRDDVALSSVTACAGNEFCEVALGGMITIPAAFIFLGEAFVRNPPGTFGLGFVSLPSVFNHMPGGQFVGFLFFFLLFLAAITSSLSMLQPAIALLEEGLGLNRKASVAFLGFITLTGALFVAYFSKGFTALDTIDFWIGTFGIYVLATIQILIFVRVLGVEEGFREIGRGAQLKLPGFIKFVLKYVAPTYLIGVFGLWAYGQFVGASSGRIAALATDRVVQLAVGWIVIVAALFLLLIAQSVRRWEKLERRGALEEGKS
jgi:SNF family Na+-dependent transporter